MRRVRRWRAGWHGVAIRVAYVNGKCHHGRARLIVNGVRVDEARGPILLGGETVVLGAPILAGGRTRAVRAVIAPAVAPSSLAPFCHIVVEGELVGGDVDRTLRVGDPDQWKEDGSPRTVLLSAVAGAVGLGLAALLFKLVYPSVPIGLAFAGGALFGLAMGGERYLRGAWLLAQVRRRHDRRPEVVA